MNMQKTAHKPHFAFPLHEEQEGTLWISSDRGLVCQEPYSVATSWSYAFTKPTHGPRAAYHLKRLRVQAGTTPGFAEAKQHWFLGRLSGLFSEDVI